MSKNNYTYLITFILLLFVLDRGIGFVFEKNFDKVSYGDCGNINNSLDADAEILICGSSRANHHYIPQLITDELGKSCYNTGIGGMGIFYDYALISSKIKKNKPNIIIFDLAPNVVADPKSYSKLNLFLPFINKDTSFLDIVKLNPDYSIMNRMSVLYKYNSTLYEMIRSMISQLDNLDGFVPLSGTANLSEGSMMHFESEIVDKNKIVYFNRIIDVCKKNEIKLFVFISPTLEKFDRKNIIINTFDSICEEKSVPFFDFSDFNKLYEKKEYFKDQLHLNHNGAKIYTNRVVQSLKKLFNE